MTDQDRNKANFQRLISEHRGVFDMFGLMIQLGVIAPPVPR